MTRFAMEMLVAVLATSVLVVFASLLAGRAGAAWAGFAAAAPITPSLAVLGTSALPPEDLLSGLPIVAAATTAIVSPWISLAVAWTAFAIIAAIWPALVRVLRLRRDVPKAQPGAA